MSMTNWKRVWFFKYASGRRNICWEVNNNYCNVSGVRAICCYFLWYFSEC